jgi:hypothetical protein
VTRLHPNRTVWPVAAAVALGAGAWGCVADASAEPPLSAVPAGVQAVPSSQLEVSVAAALPASLQTGTAVGLTASWLTTPAAAGWLRVGAAAGWGATTEYSPSWAVRHDEVRLRALLAAEQRRGVGVVGVRLGAGATVLYEARDRAQAGRLGETLSSLAVRTWAVRPALDLSATAAVLPWPSWGVGVALGPTVHGGGDSVRWGWQGAVTVRWQP